MVKFLSLKKPLIFAYKDAKCKILKYKKSANNIIFFIYIDLGLKKFCIQNLCVREKIIVISKSKKEL